MGENSRFEFCLNNFLGAGIGAYLHQDYFLVLYIAFPLFTIRLGLGPKGEEHVITVK